jgi:S-DNA-T family DNA segregation ATPase FtsK/SpoIIIE
MGNKKKRASKNFIPEKIKRYLFGTLFLLLSLIFLFGIFEKSGAIGEVLTLFLFKLIGNTIYSLPFILFLTSLVFFFSPYEKFYRGLFIAFFLSVIFLSGIFGILKSNEMGGGLFGFLLSFLTKIFGSILTQIFFWIFFILSLYIFWLLLKSPEKEELELENKPSLIKKIFFPPRFKVEKVETPISFKEQKLEEKKPEKVSLPPFQISKDYKLPPLDLLESEKGQALPGDIVQNSLIIKKTLEHFGIPVEMGEVNVGPTVTQYTLKPAEGIKLSKITSLSNDLALALASHPIRIEAPIPGKSLVGIEVPNKVRLMVRLRELLSNEKFQNSPFPLTFALGRDVAGTPIFANLAKMPHLLVAGATGTGKTIFLNGLILSLIFRNSPKSLRFILIDPKRVEFPIYNDLHHLLTPVIFDPKKAVLALQWLVGEMERRFDLLSEEKARDILSFNEIVQKTKTKEILPYIVLIIDELADLMAAKGKEIEAGIVRIAQMARAVGIHLVVATQRPSVEVLTGLIKANITSRIAFQVASQFDSRTILDTAGAEKLLGSGDLLFLSAENPKPKRIQAAYVSEKEVKRVVEFICKENEKLKIERVEISENILQEDLEHTLMKEDVDFWEEDPLYEEAKKIVIEAQKASASLLQRRLRIGYARAARLLDILEEKGIIGPGEGAKPRRVLIPPPEESEWKQI